MHAQDAPLRTSSPDELELWIRDFYRHAMDCLDAAHVPFLVGGAYSMAVHAGIVRHTKDFDVFVMKHDAQRALAALEQGGYRAEMTFPHWLGKAFHLDAFVDVIFGSGNGLCPVDRQWMDHAVPATVLDRPVKICPAEEVLWTKCFIQERERFDGADVNHLLLARAKTLDWQRLLQRFEGHENVLLAHLLLFAYAFPDHRDDVPQWVHDLLLARAQAARPPAEKLCRGTFLSREQYLIDLRERGYTDPRTTPHGGHMSPEQAAQWTAAIGTIR